VKKESRNNGYEAEGKAF